MRPRLLDLFCGGGGAAMGYWLAGFDVVGVDVKRRPDYPFEYHQADALAFPTDGFDAIHASPPRQAHSITANLARAQGKKASDVNLIPATRDLLVASGLPYVIENVPGAPLHNAVQLCGSSFGLGVQRHRLFECSFAVLAPPCMHNEQGRPVGVYGSMRDDIPRGGKTADDLEQASAAMGIDWLPWSRLKEAIPPAYTEFIGHALIDYLARVDPRD